MESIEKVKSALKMEKLSIISANLKCSPDFKKGNLLIKISKTTELLPENKHLITLNTTVSDNAENLSISVGCSAKFFVEGDLESNLTRSLIEKNAVAIMFPYVRSYISLITSVPNMTPIVLPPVNIIKLIEDQENNEKSENN